MEKDMSPRKVKNALETHRHKAQKAGNGAARELEAYTYTPSGESKLESRSQYVAKKVRKVPQSTADFTTAKFLKAKSESIDASKWDSNTNKRKKGGEAEAVYALKKVKPDVQKEKVDTSVITRKQRRNRKKNNSKKNKFRHPTPALSVENGKGCVVGMTMNSTESQKSDAITISKAGQSPTLTSSSGKTTGDIHGNSRPAKYNAKLAYKQQKLSMLRKSAQNVRKSKQVNTKILKTRLKTRVVNEQLSNFKHNLLDVSESDDKGNTQDNSDDKDSTQDLSGIADSFSLSDSSYTTPSETLIWAANKTEKKEKYPNKTKPPSFADKARDKLNAARFRYLNEQLYTSTGKKALEMFQDDPEAFEVYHHGFQGQVSRWPLNPLDTIIKQLSSM